MPVLICLRKELWTGPISVGDQVPTCPVFTRAKIKSHLGILDNLPSQDEDNSLKIPTLESILIRNSLKTIEIKYNFIYKW